MLRLPRVYPILDTESLERVGIALAAAAAALLEGGARILQVRHKSHWNRDLFAAAHEVSRLCREGGALLIVDDRADFALLLGAGLHVGQDDLSPRDARTLLPAPGVIGYSTHNAAQLAAAGGEPVDYVALGPVFGTSSKRNPDPVLGVEGIRQCRGLVEKPLVAIGGITLETARDVWAAGADSVAVIGGLLSEGALGGARVSSPAALRQRFEQWLSVDVRRTGY
jgi:thiamine-phosphate pyrophosphorylase